MRLNELQTDRRFLFVRVPCSSEQSKTIDAEVGRLETHGSNEFMLRSRAGSIVFKINNPIQSEEIRDLIRRKFVGLASVFGAASAGGRNFFCLRIVFFMRKVRVGGFRMILGDEVKGALNPNSATELFLFDDGVGNEKCFAFSIIKTVENENDPIRSKALQIHGRDQKLLVRLEGEDDESQAIAYRLISDRSEDRAPLRLAYGSLEFTDEKSCVAARVQEIFRGTPEYMTIRNEYAEREGEFLLRRARAVGSIAFQNEFNRNENGLELNLVKGAACDLSYLLVGDLVEARPLPPPYIVDEQMTWAQYLERTRRAEPERYRSYEVTDKSSRALTLKLDKDDDEPPPDWNLYLSIAVEEKRIEAETLALERLENGTSAAPNIGLILGDRIEDAALDFGFGLERSFFNPRSALINEKIFRSAPTLNQIEAINVALNTPDIAVISGAPGTGKTLVVNAIRERLNELAAEHRERVSIDSPSTTQFDQTERERRLFECFEPYLQSPSNAKALNFLRLARRLTLDSDPVERIEAAIAELESSPASVEEELLAKIYRLPTTPESFEDGGRDACIELFNALEPLFGRTPTEFQRGVLQRLRDAAMIETTSENFFERLAKLKSELSARCKQPIAFEAEELRADVCEIYGELKLSLRRTEDALENNVRELARETRDFDAVIVDDASRVTPGELIVHLSQAARRIILVGDPRQLPRVRDEEFFRADDIRTSLFEHIRKKARALEKSDGIKRTVTLDAQHRMHPTLGNFISRNFYEPYGEEFRSPRPASEFAQSISRSAVLWLNVPASRGLEQRTTSHSLVRLCEVNCIVEALKKFLGEPKNRQLTFGVFTFYRAQAQALKMRLREFGARVRVGLVDEFQGTELDVIFFSIVRIDGFLTDERLSAALSRQKRLLIAVGDASMFEDEKASRAAKLFAPSMLELYRLCKREGGVVDV